VYLLCAPPLAEFGESEEEEVEYEEETIEFLEREDFEIIGQT
jgi:hypothetical protein